MSLLHLFAKSSHMSHQRSRVRKADIYGNVDSTPFYKRISEGKQ